MPPGLFYRALDDLNNRLFRDQRDRTDIVIGVNHGGAIIGSKLYYMNRQLFHFTVFWMDVYSELRSRTQRLADAEAELAVLLDRIQESRGLKPSILLVDDTLRSGRAMAPAIRIVRKLAPDASLRIGCIIYRPDMAVHYDPEDLQEIICTPDLRRFATGAYDRIFYER
jgi:hypoxanthine phosphoribosyltransferase